MGPSNKSAYLTVLLSLIIVAGITWLILVADTKNHNVEKASGFFDGIYFVSKSVNATGASIPHLYFTLPGKSTSFLIAPPTEPMLQGVKAYFNALAIKINEAEIAQLLRALTSIKEQNSGSNECSVELLLRSTLPSGARSIEWGPNSALLVSFGGRFWSYFSIYKFLSYSNNTRYELQEIETFNLPNIAVSWGPDDIIAVAQSKLYNISTSYVSLLNITDKKVQTNISITNVNRVYWSPNGKFLALLVAKPSSHGIGARGYSLIMYNYGNRSLKLQYVKDLGFWPIGGEPVIAFSPDSQLIAITGSAPLGNSNTWIIDTITGQVLRTLNISSMMNNKPCAFISLVWSPDSEKIAFAAKCYTDSMHKTLMIIFYDVKTDKIERTIDLGKKYASLHLLKLLWYNNILIMGLTDKVLILDVKTATITSTISFLRNSWILDLDLDKKRGLIAILLRESIFVSAAQLYEHRDLVLIYKLKCKTGEKEEPDTTVVKNYRNLLLQRAYTRYHVLKSLYQGFTNPDWWLNASKQRMHWVYSYLMSILSKELDMSIPSVLSEAIINTVMPDIASTVLDFAKMLTYMYAIEVSTDRFIGAIDLWIKAEEFLGAYGVLSTARGGDCVVTGPHLMAYDYLIKEWSSHWSYENAYKTCNVRFLIYNMMKIVREEIRALINEDYNKYLKLLQLEKNYAKRILDILDNGLAKAIDNAAYQAFIEDSNHWSTGLMYIEARRGLEALYLLLADTWVFEYTFILEEKAEPPTYKLELPTVYWLPAVNITITPEDRGYNALIRLSMGQSYRYKGGLRIEVYAVYDLRIFEHKPKIAEKKLESLIIEPSKEQEFVITFKKDKLYWLNPVKYRVEVYALNPVIIDNEYTSRLKRAREGLGELARSVYEKYFSKILIGIAEIPGGGRAVVSGHLVRLDESQHKLYLAVVTGDGKIVGYHKGDVVVEAPRALFLDLGNGTQLAYLPPEISNYTIVIDAANARQLVEAYNVTIYYVEKDVVSSAKISALIKRGEQHRLAVTKLANTIKLKIVEIKSYNIVYSKGVEVVTQTTTKPATKTIITSSRNEGPHRQTNSIMMTISGIVALIILTAAILIISKIKTKTLA